MNTLLIQLSTSTWTRQAVHLACALGRQLPADVALLYLAEVNSPALLGTEFGMVEMPPEVCKAVEEYRTIADTYGIDLSLKRMQCVSKADALVQAVGHTGATGLFAHIPHAAIPMWHDFQRWWLRQQVEAQGCTLYAIEEKTREDWQPAIRVETARQHIAR